ncbi:hypothetical protein [Pokkaliibacter plantistimulans]|nr:hypothetical protein [Pokkaliibacter plantistimulans]
MPLYSFTKTKVFFLFVFLTLGCWRSGWADEASIIVKLDQRDLTTVTLSELRTKLPVTDVHIDHPFLRKEKNYRAVALKALLEMVYGERLKGVHQQVIFKAIDGYEASGDIGHLLQEGGYIAFADLDRQGEWEPVTKMQADPSPYFLVWTAHDQTIGKGYPWPWAISSIDLRTKP